MPVKSFQVCFRVEDDIADQVRAAAEFEELKVADLARRLFRRAFLEYKSAGSLHALRSRDVEKQSKVAEETHDKSKSGERNRSKAS